MERKSPMTLGSPLPFIQSQLTHTSHVAKMKMATAVTVTQTLSAQLRFPVSTTQTMLRVKKTDRGTERG